jgi:hypothetical protein
MSSHHIWSSTLMVFSNVSGHHENRKPLSKSHILLLHDAMKCQATSTTKYNLMISWTNVYSLRTPSLVVCRFVSYLLSASYCYFDWLTLLLWRWRRYIPSKWRLSSFGPYGLISQKIPHSHCSENPKSNMVLTQFPRENPPSKNMY